MRYRVLGNAIYVLSAATGILAFAYPFFSPTAASGSFGVAHSQDAPLITTVLVSLSLLALLVELQGQAISAKTVAMLGVLVATASILRFIELATPVPGGFSPIFVPIILSGYVFGGRFGFLMGTFTMLTSALITGGVGPWLPYQMFTTGWVGMTAGWLSGITNRGPRNTGKPRIPNPVPLLSIFGFLWGLLYGAIINVYFWPFAMGSVEQAWAPEIGIRETLVRYATFYGATSLGWDMVRAVGNATLILLLGAPTIRAFTRFQRRFHFEVWPADG